ncbi:MAG TPA: cupin domain-containing protein [Dehalococcoidia bacterium]|nr:cupin domain-containing protein [Dehalococcoidia bacterium]
MRRKLLPFIVAPVLMLGAVPALLGGFGERALADHTPSHPIVETVARSEFIDDVSAQFKLRLAGTKPQNVIRVPNASEVAVVRITFRPGDRIGWHTHPGPAIAVVEQGELTITNATDCVARPYAAGQAFLDPGTPNIHRADNFGTTDAVVHVTYLAVPAGMPPTTLLERPSC